MSGPFGRRASFVLVTVLAAAVAYACSSQSPEVVGAAGTSGASAAPFRIAIESSQVVVENLTGVPLVDGKVELVVSGPLRPFSARLSRMEHMASASIALTRFTGSDGTVYNRRLARARTVRVTATDVVGKQHEMSVPFE